MTGSSRDAPDRPKQAALPSADEGPASPCNKVCKINERTGWCEGCARSIEEIMFWGRADADTQRAILSRLPERRRQMQEMGIRQLQA